MKIELDSPNLGELEKRYLCECVDSSFVSPSISPVLVLALDSSDAFATPSAIPQYVILLENMF